MSKQAVLTLVFSPTTVTVHDESNMAGDVLKVKKRNISFH
jgi:hypothetical protein